MSRNQTGQRHVDRISLSTRRSFIAAASLGAVSLYGLWAGLGAAPLRIWDLGGAGMSGKDMSNGDHGARGGASPEEFRLIAEAFNESHRQPDGSVAVDSSARRPSMAGTDMSANVKHPGHERPSVSDQQASHVEGSSPRDVYVLAQQWSFEPNVLRLRANEPHRFRMMAVDAAHGASIQLGLASHIIRLPKGVLVERELTFTKAGEYLIYCTIYCGEGHQFMSARIFVS